MKPVKCDAAILHLARATLIERLRSRLEPIMSDVSGTPSVTGFRDPEFIKAFGPGLEKFPDSELVNQALLLLAEHVAGAPAGQTGLPFFDDRARAGRTADNSEFQFQPVSIRGEPLSETVLRDRR